MYKVTERDLIGDIKDFPIEVVQKMLERQVEQGNRTDVTVFQKIAIGGFEWRNTTEGHEFWREVVSNGDFDLFFKKYPKRNIHVYYRGVPNRGDEIIAELEKLGGVNRFDYDGILDNRLYFIRPLTKSIDFCSDDDECSELLKDAYTEIFLPEKVDLLR